MVSESLPKLHKIYLPSVRERDGDTIDSYRHCLSLYQQPLRFVRDITHQCQVGRFLPREYYDILGMAA